LVESGAQDERFFFVGLGGTELRGISLAGRGRTVRDVAYTKLKM